MPYDSAAENAQRVRTLLEFMALAEGISARIGDSAHKGEIRRVMEEESRASGSWSIDALWSDDGSDVPSRAQVGSEPVRGGRAMLAPIRVLGKATGVIVVRSSAPVDWCLPGVERLAREVSLALGLTEERSLRLKALREAAVNASIAELSKMLMGPTPIEDLSYLVLQDAKRLTGSRYGFVGYIDPQTGYLIRPTLTRDIWDECKVERKCTVLKEFTGLRGYVLKTRRSVLSNSPATDPRSVGVPKGHIPIERFLSAPALVGGKLLGQVAVANSAADYTDEDLSVLERLASVYAVAVHRKHMDAELIRLERLMALDSLAGAVSHNLNNILAGVLGHAQLLRRKTQDPRLLRGVDVIVKAGLRARDLVQRLGDAVGGEDEEPHPVAVNMVVRQALEDMRRRLRDRAVPGLRRVEVDTRLRDLPSARATLSGLYRVISGLLSNAREAMPDGGKVTITTECTGVGVILRVTDTGRGMNAEALKRAFEPFFTTSARVGAGLGLSIAQRLVLKWGGQIEIGSARGEGTEVTVTLPTWEESADSREDADAIGNQHGEAA